MLIVGEFNLSSVPEYTNSFAEVLKQTMIGQEIVFRNQVYELHRLYQIQKTLAGESVCKELDAYNFWKGSLQSPVGPFTNSMHNAALAEGKVFRNPAESELAGATEYLNKDQFSDCYISSRNEVDLTLRIGEDTGKKGTAKEACYEKNSRLVPHCVIDLEASTDTISQENTKNSSGLSYATPEKETRFYVQANQDSTFSVKTAIFHEIGNNCTLYGGKSCKEENSFNIGCKEPNSCISSNATSLKRKLFASNESMEFDFDLNKVQCDYSFDLNGSADTCLLTSPFDKLKGIYSDEASCSYATSCEKVDTERLYESSITPPRKNISKEYLANICDVEITEMLQENVFLLQPCKIKTRLEDSNSNGIRFTTPSVEQTNDESVEVNDLVQKAAELLLHFSLGSSVSKRDYSTNIGSNLIQNEESDRPQCSVDSYESLVLKLEETSVDDYCVSSKAFEVDEFDKKESGAIWRRGRRLKDFQKDILPNLVSLSRHEICEDVGIMEAVMRSREYKRMRSKAGNGEKWSTPTKCKKSRPRRRYS